MLSEPFDLLRFSIDEKVDVVAKGEKILKGTLHGFDQHLNMVLGDAEEIITVDGEMTSRRFDTIFVRGDIVITVSPLVGSLVSNKVK